jgi:hypothetical protein
MADCPDPRFITRGGDIRRHHFAHHVAHVKHTTAAVWRTEAMTMLAEWASRYRHADVDAEDRDGPARVRVRSQRSGRSVELRVTYDRRYEPPLEVTPPTAPARGARPGLRSRSRTAPISPSGEDASRESGVLVSAIPRAGWIQRPGRVRERWHEGGAVWVGAEAPWLHPPRSGGSCGHHCRLRRSPRTDHLSTRSMVPPAR